MDERRYFYSKTGTDVHGPVTKLALFQLFQNKALDSTSFLCLESASQWEKLNPAMFKEQRPLPLPTPPLMVELPNRKRKRNSWCSKEGLLDPRIQRRLTVVNWISALIGAGVGVHLRYVVFVNTEPEPGSPYEFLGYFCGAAIAIAMAAYLISVLFSEVWRQFVRTIGIICFSMLFIFLSYHMLSGDTTIHPSQTPVVDSSTPPAP